MNSFVRSLAVLVATFPLLARAEEPASAPPPSAAAPAVPAGETPYPPPTTPPQSTTAVTQAPTAPAGESAVAHTVIRGLDVAAELGQGVTVSTDDGRYSLNIRARFQVRDTAIDTQSPEASGKGTTSAWTNDANIKTFRLIFDGHLLSKNIDYFLQLAEGGGDFVATTSQTPSPIYDAFLDFTWLRDLNIRVGQFYIPFDRARTIREYALQFVDRQQVVNELALNRGLGIKLFSEDLFGTGGRLSYALGAFYNDGINDFTNTVPGLLSVARVAIKPFGAFDDDIEGDLLRLPRPRLAIGGAIAWNQHTSLNQSTFGTLLPAASTTSVSSNGTITGVSQTLGSPGTLDYLHADADLVFKYHGFSFLGEFLYRQADPGDVKLTTTTTTITTGAEGKTTTTSKVTNAARNARGYVLQGGYLFTDWFELTGRFDQLLAVGNTDPTLVSLANQDGREAGGGINFYLHHHLLKLQADYFHYWGPQDDHGKDQIRVQIDCSI